MKALRATLTAALLSFLAPVTAADAGPFGSCNNRPGTPTNLVATFDDYGLRLTFINTATPSLDSAGNALPLYWDVEVRDGAGNPVGLDTTGGYGMPYAVGSASIPYDRSAFKPDTTYCFRVRARTQAGTKGCVSQIWGNQACVTTPNDKFCKKYADDAFNQSKRLKDLHMAGDCGPSGDRWLAGWREHYNWCLAVRGDPNGVDAPDNERKARQDTLERCDPALRLLHTHLPPVSSMHFPNSAPPPLAPPPPPASSQAPPPPAPTVCAVNALVTVDQCYNLDSTP